MAPGPWLASASLPLGAVLTGMLMAAGLVSTPLHAVEVIKPRVIDSFPHDPGAFTQGLVSVGDQLFESTGLYGESSLRRVQLETGFVVQQIELDAAQFGEGLALVDDRLIQLTWQNGIAHVYDRDTFSRLTTYAYEGEGWGLCFDGQHLVMSDGSSSLFFRDPETFELERTIGVTIDGEPRDMLNELECVDGAVFANIWQTDLIVRINALDGAVTSLIDASDLLSLQERAAADVLNGIAYDPVRDSFLLTGKLWPRLFEVALEVSGPEGPRADALDSPDVPDSSDVRSNRPDSSDVPDSCECALGDAPLPNTPYVGWGTWLMTAGLVWLRRRRRLQVNASSVL